MRSYSSREVLKILKDNGWYEVGCDGDHHQFKHPKKRAVSPLPIREKIFLLAH